MNNQRVKWIRKVVVSRHPKVSEMIVAKYGKERADKMTYKQVIRACKKFWKKGTKGIEEWSIFERAKEN